MQIRMQSLYIIVDIEELRLRSAYFTFLCYCFTTFIVLAINKFRIAQTNQTFLNKDRNKKVNYFCSYFNSRMRYVLISSFCSGNTYLIS